MLADLKERQIALERDAVSRGIDRYQKALKEARSKGSVENLGPEIKMMMQNIMPLERGIKIYLEKAQRGNPKFHKIKTFLKECPPDTLAYLTLRKALNSCVSGTHSLQHISMGIADDILTEMNYRKFKEAAPGYVWVLENRSNISDASPGHKTKAMQALQAKLGVSSIGLSKSEKMALGQTLLSIACKCTNLIELTKMHRPARKNSEAFMYSIGLTEEAMGYLDKAHKICQELRPLYLPMLIEPKKWTNPWDGGYLTLKSSLVKSRRNEVQLCADQSRMEPLLDSLNKLQSVRYSINTDILEVLKITRNVGLGKLPSPDKERDLPPKFWSSDEEFERLKEEDPEAITQWKWATREVMDNWHRNRSKRIALSMTIALADEFKDEEAIYFPWTIDWRGRAYPIPSPLNPQGNDVSKALLRYTEGVRIGNGEGPKYLAYHGANCFGEDKCSLSARIQWVKKHEEAIVESAENPLDGRRFWCEADDPYKFLAFCFEWAGYLKEGASFVTHLPCHADATCNGLQHFSAILSDPVGGSAVNLVPHEVPADIYAQVAQKAAQKVAKDAAEGDECAKVWHGKIDRGIAKRNTMTTPYGATLFGYMDQLDNEVRKRSEEQGSPFLGKDIPKKAMSYMARTNKAAIDEVVVKGREAMDFLQALAKVAAPHCPKGIRWTTPLGLQACQLYEKTETRRIESLFGDIKIKTNIQEFKEDTINEIKHRNAFAPNFVHSQDATHLFMSINKVWDAGVRSFSTVHDSFATHAPHMSELHRALRVSFVQLYENKDTLERVREEVKNQIPECAWDDLPEVPVSGDLDIKNVLKSDYFVH